MSVELRPGDYIPIVRCWRCERPESEMGEWIAEIAHDDTPRPLCETCQKGLDDD